MDAQQNLSMLFNKKQLRLTTQVQTLKAEAQNQLLLYCWYLDGNSEMLAKTGDFHRNTRSSTKSEMDVDDDVDETKNNVTYSDVNLIDATQHQAFTNDSCTVQAFKKYG
jgi:hypothetical protein